MKFGDSIYLGMDFRGLRYGGGRFYGFISPTACHLLRLEATAHRAEETREEGCRGTGSCHPCSHLWGKARHTVGCCCLRLARLCLIELIQRAQGEERFVLDSFKWQQMVDEEVALEVRESFSLRRATQCWSRLPREEVQYLPGDFQDSVKQNHG